MDKQHVPQLPKQTGFDELDKLDIDQPRTFIKSLARYNHDIGKYNLSPVMTEQELKKQIYYTLKANPPRKINEVQWGIKDLLNDFERSYEEGSKLPEALVENGVAIANAVFNHSSAALKAFSVATDYIKDRLKDKAVDAGVLNIMTQHDTNQYFSCQKKRYDEAVTQGRGDKTFMTYMEKKADKNFAAKLTTNIILFSVAIAQNSCPFFTPVGMLFTVIIWLNEKDKERQRESDYELAVKLVDERDRIRQKAQRLIDFRNRTEQEGQLMSDKKQDSEDESWFGYWWDTNKRVAYYVTFGQIASLSHQASARVEQYLDNEMILQGLAFGRIKTTLLKDNKADGKVVWDNLDWHKLLEDDKLMKNINDFWKKALNLNENSTTNQVRHSDTVATGTNARNVPKKTT